MMGAAFPPSAKPLHLHTIHKLIELAVIIHDIHMPQWLPAYSHFKAKTMRPHGLLSLSTHTLTFIHKYLRWDHPHA